MDGIIIRLNLMWPAIQAKFFLTKEIYSYSFTSAATIINCFTLIILIYTNLQRFPSFRPSCMALIWDSVFLNVVVQQRVRQRYLCKRPTQKHLYEADLGESFGGVIKLICFGSVQLLSS